MVLNFANKISVIICGGVAPKPRNVFPDGRQIVYELAKRSRCAEAEKCIFDQIDVKYFINL